MSEIVQYGFEGDSSKAEACNARVANSMKQITTSTNQTASALEHYNKAGTSTISTNNNMAASLKNVEKVTVLGKDRFTSFSNTVESTGTSMLKATGAFGAMNSTLGGMPNLLLGVAGGLDNVADKSNALTSSLKVAKDQIGGFGTAALIAGAAF